MLFRSPDDMGAVVAGEGFSALPISLRHAQQAGALPDLHRDPFDRLIAATALVHGWVLISADTAFDTLTGLRRIW